MDSDDIVESFMILSDLDYPGYYNGRMHPNDGKSCSSPEKPELLYHAKTYHNRLLLRIPFKLSDNEFVTFTFICNTGFPGFFYLSDKVHNVISRRIISNKGGNNYIDINGELLSVFEVPSNYGDSNILGLEMLSMLGLRVHNRIFQLDNLPDFF